MAKKETTNHAAPVLPMLKTVEQMSKVSGIGENKLRELIDNGELEYVQNGNRRLIADTAIWDWYERAKTAVKPPAEQGGKVMAISTRQVKNKRDSNGVLTGRPGTVYDVNIKYTAPDGKKKSYAKKGFATKK